MSSNSCRQCGIISPRFSFHVAPTLPRAGLHWPPQESLFTTESGLQTSFGLEQCSNPSVFSIFFKLHAALNPEHFLPLAPTQPPYFDHLYNKGNQHHGLTWGPPLKQRHSETNELKYESSLPTPLLILSAGMIWLHCFHYNSIVGIQSHTNPQKPITWISF